MCVSNFGELPKYLGIFDVCLIPFEVDEFTKKIYPKKFHQYMAAGKPVVSSRLPELEPFAPRVEFYSDIKEIEVKIKKLLSEDAKEKVLERRKIANAYTCDRRIESVIPIFNTIVKERMPSS